MMDWMHKIATCPHEKLVSVRISGWEFRVCEECGRLEGHNSVSNNWHWVGSFSLPIYNLRHEEIKARIRQDSEIEEVGSKIA